MKTATIVLCASIISLLIGIVLGYQFNAQGKYDAGKYQGEVLTKYDICQKILKNFPAPSGDFKEKEKLFISKTTTVYVIEKDGIPSLIVK